MKKSTKYFVALLLAITLLFSVLSLPTFAAGETGSISLFYVHDGAVLEGVNVRLYYVADISPDKQYTLSGEFKNYSVDLNSTASRTQWNQCANTLSAYAASDSITPDSTAETNKGGSAVFAELKQGLYLITSDNLTVDDSVYTFSSLLISVPVIDDDGNPVFEIEANTKSEVHNRSEWEANSHVEYKVVKLWNDSGYETERPVSVTVDIIKDGKTVSTQTLSRDNNWTYKWAAKVDGSLWQVAERDVNSLYTVSVDKSDYSFIITNTASPKKADSPSSVQTGSFGGGIILLTEIAGLCLIIIGFYRLRKDIVNEKN